MFTNRLQKTTKSWTWTTKWTNRLQKTSIDYKKSDTHYKVTNRLQNIIKFGHTLQSSVVNNKRLQKSDLDYKVY